LKVQRSANLQDREWPVPAAAVIGPGSPAGCSQSWPLSVAPMCRPVGPSTQRTGVVDLYHRDATVLSQSVEHAWQSGERALQSTKSASERVKHPPQSAVNASHSVMFRLW